jgi:hypothetical protein
MKNIAIEELLSSKVFVKESGAVSFHSPLFYFDKFIKTGNELGADWRATVTDEVIVAEEDETRNVAYPRVLLEAQFEEVPELKGFIPTVGVLYALDVQKPVIKCYSGFNVSVCMNLTIFNATALVQKDLLGDISEIYTASNKFLNDKPAELKVFKSNVEALKNSELELPGFDRLTGELIRFGMQSRFGTQMVLGAVKTMRDPNSRYYVPEEQKTTKWNYFNALTQQITDGRDLLDRANKTIELAQIMLN